MSGKTISNSTLSLRFMQNAQRAKLQAQVDAEQAKIKDDAEWSVSQAVRDAWGIGASASAGSSSSTARGTGAQAVTYEASYAPFIFGREDDDAGEDGEEAEAEDGDAGAGPSTRPALVRGRRTFDDRGREVLRKEEPAPEPQEPAEAGGLSNALKGKGRPTSISGFKAPLPPKARDGKTSRTKTAQELIREAPLPSAPPPPSAADAGESRTSGFMKPAGVDAPPPAGTTKSGAKKRHRDRDAGPDATDSKGKRRKKRTVEAGLATVE